MTRRIALAILLTVWATLIAGGATAYFITRAVMLAELDASLVTRAMSVTHVNEQEDIEYLPVHSPEPDDRYIVRDEVGRTVARPSTTTARVQAQVVRAAFAPLPDGSRVRTLTLRIPARRRAGGEPAMMTVAYSGSAEQFDRLLGRLAWSLAGAGALGGLLAAGIAYAVAHRSLLPLRHTAEVVGSINEQCLHRRISQDDLPPELVPVATRLNEMLARLEQSRQQREQFIADASHELRTPVAALVTALEVSLRRLRDAEAYRQTLTTCLADAQLLQRLVEALLAQARSGLTPRGYDAEDVDLGEIIGQCVTALSPLAEQRDIRVQVETSEDLLVRTEPDRVRSIVLNLLGNAIEYNRVAGSVTICCQRKGREIILQIADTGPGIAPEQVPQLFQPLFRGDSARTSGHLGLGLYLVRSHARALGGDCTVESQMGRGTSFCVQWPVEEPAKQQEFDERRLVRSG